MQKRLSITALVMSALFWMGPGRLASAATFKCQATATDSYAEYSSSPADEVSTEAASAAWTVSTLSTTKFSSGVQTVNYNSDCSCIYNLNTTTSSLVVANGTSNQTLNWVLSRDQCGDGCYPIFTDDVYLVSNSAGTGVFADSNAGGYVDGSAGTCLPQ